MLHNCQNCSHWKLISKVRLTVIQIWLSVFLFLSLQINTLIHIPWQKLHLNFNSKLHIWMDGRRDGGRVGGRDGGLGGGLETHHDLFPWRKQSTTPSVFPPKLPLLCFHVTLSEGMHSWIVYLFGAQKSFTLQGNKAPQEDWGGGLAGMRSLFFSILKWDKGKRGKLYSEPVYFIFSLCNHTEEKVVF